MLVLKYNCIVKEENDEESDDSESVLAYPSCGKCGKMFPTNVTLAQHMMQHKEEDEAINNDGKEENNDSDKESDVTMNTETQEVPEKCMTRGSSKQNTAAESTGKKNHLKVILCKHANLPKALGVKRVKR